jgi:hypothetical protein
MPGPATGGQRTTKTTQISTWSKSKKWAAGILAVALAGALTTILVNVFTGIGHVASQLIPKASGTSSPVFVAVRREAGFSGGCGTWIVTKPIESVAAPSSGGASEQWIEQTNAIDATFAGVADTQPHGTSNIDVTIQGRTSTPVILTGIQFIAVRRSTKTIPGAAVTVGCGGPMEASGITVDLDTNPIKIQGSFSDSLTGTLPSMPAGQPQWLVTPLKFPYQVTDTDGEVFKIIAYAQSYVSWYAILYWSTDGQNGQSVINDNGRPFQTAPANLAAASYGYQNNKWYACSKNATNCLVN